MIPLGDRLTTITGKSGNPRYVTRPCFGIVQQSKFSTPGKVLVLVVDKQGEPWPMDNANPRWIPEELLRGNHD